MSLGFTTNEVKAQAILFLILCEVSMLNIVMGLLWEHFEIFFEWLLHVPLSYCSYIIYVLLVLDFHVLKIWLHARAT